MNITAPVRLNTTNMPGGKKISFVDVTDIIAIPQPDPDGVLNGIIQLKPGANIVTINSVIPNSLAATITEELIEGSTFYSIQVGFSIARISPSRLKLVNIAARRRFLAIYEDNNGLQWLCGAKDIVGKLSLAGGSSGQNPVEDENKVDFIFNVRLSSPLYFYDSNTGDIFDSTFTPEFL